MLTADPIKARVAGGTAGAGLRAEGTAGGLLARLRYTLSAVNVLTLCKERGQEQLLSGTGSLTRTFPACSAPARISPPP